MMARMQYDFASIDGSSEREVGLFKKTRSSGEW